MAITKMKRLELIALCSHRDSLFRQLQQLGCVQITTTREEGPTPGGLQAILETERQVKQARQLLLSADTERPALFSPRIRLHSQELFDPRLRRQAQARTEALLAAGAQAAALEQEIAQTRSLRAQLLPWLGLDIPLEASSTSTVTALFAALPARTEWERVLASLGSAGELCVFIQAETLQGLRHFFLLCHASVADAALTALTQLGMTRITFPGLTGTAWDNDARLSSLLKEQEAALTQARRAMAGERGDGALLGEYLDALAQDRARKEAEGRVAALGETFHLTGWFPAPELPAVGALLNRLPCAWTAQDPPPGATDVPIQLRNNALTRPLNVVTELYALPAYDGVDPNPLMAPFFILFFGFMMADMAYGLLMILGTLFFLHRTRPPESRRNFLLLFCYCGVSALFWGALTGSFFGDFIPRLAALIDPNTTLTALPALFTPLDDTIAIMVGSMALGGIQIFTGMAISVVEKCRKGLFLDALFDEVTWWILLLGGALMLLLPQAGGVGGALLLLGGLMLAFGGTRKAHGLVGKLASLIGLVYNGVTGFFSDILSYLRLMALMMAGSIISQVFNTLGSVFGNIPGFLLVSLIGNGLNFALNLLGCYVHTLRLQCLEFFGRFYQSGGRPFQPLKLATTYTELIKEEG